MIRISLENGFECRYENKGADMIKSGKQGLYKDWGKNL